MTPDITLPEVQVFKQVPRFFRDEKGRDMIEVSFVGSKDTLINKVSPDHMAQFRDAWTAFCDGQPLKRREGTPLTECMPPELADTYVNRNVHTMEELAVLSDAQCQGLGHGTLTFREKARKLIGNRKAEALEVARKTISDATSSMSSAPSEAAQRASSDIAEMKQQLSELNQGISSLVTLLTEQAQKKVGRPKKAAED